MRVVVVRRGDITGALNVALDSPPYGSNVEEAKVRPLPPPPPFHIYSAPVTRPLTSPHPTPGHDSVQ